MTVQKTNIKTDNIASGNQISIGPTAGSGFDFQNNSEIRVFAFQDGDLEPCVEIEFSATPVVGRVTFKLESNSIPVSNEANATKADTIILETPSPNSPSAGSSYQAVNSVLYGGITKSRFFAIRETELKQNHAYQEGDKYFAKNNEEVVDKSMQAIQELDYRLDRSLQFDKCFDPTEDQNIIPRPVEDQVLQWDASGNLQNETPYHVKVSTNDTAPNDLDNKIVATGSLTKTINPAGPGDEKLEIGLDETTLNHDNLSGFVGDEHVPHSGVVVTANAPLTGGGDIASSFSIGLDQSGIDHNNIANNGGSIHVDHATTNLVPGNAITVDGGTAPVDTTASRTIAVDITGQTALAGPSIDGSNDEVLIWDSSASAMRKVTAGDLVGAGVDDKRVKTNIDDNTPGFLSDKIITLDNSGNNTADPIEIDVTPGGVADNDLRIKFDEQKIQITGSQVTDFETVHDGLPNDNPHTVTLTQALTADSSTATKASIEEVTNGSTTILHKHDITAKKGGAVDDVITGLSAKGQLVTFDGTNSRNDVLPVGANDQILIADSTTDLGIRWGTNTASADEKVGVELGDTAGFLKDKLVAGTNVTITETGPVGNKQLAISAAAGVASSEDTTGATGKILYGVEDNTAKFKWFKFPANSDIAGTDPKNLGEYDWEGTQLHLNRVHKYDRDFLTDIGVYDSSFNYQFPRIGQFEKRFFKVKKGLNWFAIGHDENTDQTNQFTIRIDGKSITDWAAEGKQVLDENSNPWLSDNITLQTATLLVQRQKFFFGGPVSADSEQIVEIFNNTTNNRFFHWTDFSVGYATEPSQLAVGYEDIKINTGKILVRGQEIDVVPTDISFEKATGYGRIDALVQDTAGSGITVVKGTEGATTKAKHNAPFGPGYVHEDTSALDLYEGIPQGPIVSVQNNFYFPDKGICLAQYPSRGEHKLFSYTEKARGISDTNAAHQDRFKGVRWETDADLSKIYSGTVSGVSTASAIDVNTNTNRIKYNSALKFTSGALSGEVRRIVTLTPNPTANIDTDTINVDPPFSGAPSLGDSFDILYCPIGSKVSGVASASSTHGEVAIVCVADGRNTIEIVAGVNDKIEWVIPDEGATVHDATLTPGLYTADLIRLGDEITKRMQEVHPLVDNNLYVCEYNKITKKWVLGIREHGSVIKSISFPLNTGAFAATNIMVTDLGFDGASDLSGSLDYTATLEKLHLAVRAFEPGQFYDAESPTIMYSVGDSTSPGDGFDAIRENFGIHSIRASNATWAHYKIYPDKNSCGVELLFIPDRTSNMFYIQIDKGDIFCVTPSDRDRYLDWRGAKLLQQTLTYPLGTHEIKIYYQANYGGSEYQTPTNHNLFAGYRTLMPKPALETIANNQSAFKYFKIRPKDLYQTRYGIGWDGAQIGNNLQKKLLSETVIGTGWTFPANGAVFTGRERITTTLNDHIVWKFQIDEDGGGFGCMLELSVTEATEIGCYICTDAEFVANGNAPVLDLNHQLHAFSPDVTDPGLEGFPDTHPYSVVGLKAGVYHVTVRITETGPLGSRLMPTGFIVIDGNEQQNLESHFRDGTNQLNLATISWPWWGVDQAALTWDGYDSVPSVLRRTKYNSQKPVGYYAISDNAYFVQNEDTQWLATNKGYFVFQTTTREHAGSYIGHFKHCESIWMLDANHGSHSALAEYRVNDNVIKVQTQHVNVKNQLSVLNHAQHRTGIPNAKGHFYFDSNDPVNAGTVTVDPDVAAALDIVEIPYVSNVRENSKVAFYKADGTEATRLVISKNIITNRLTLDSPLPAPASDWIEIRFPGMHNYKVTTNQALVVSFYGLGWKMMPVQEWDLPIKLSNKGEVARVTYMDVGVGFDISLPVYEDGTYATFSECVVEILRNGAATWDFARFGGWKDPILSGSADIRITAIRGDR